MFSLVFLVCMVGKPCLTMTNSAVFSNYEDCSRFAEEVIATNRKRTEEGSFANHTADYQCISWEKA